MRRGGPQQIPRPARARPGRRAPWGSPPPAVTLAAVRARLATRGPAGGPDRVVDGARPAAVLVPLFEEGGDVRVLLTRRTGDLPSHRGEVAFPGGRVEEGETPVAAALREAHEEIGLDPAAVEIVGELDRLSTVSSRFVITPFVGILRGRPALRPNPHEIERVFDVPLGELLLDEVYREEIWDLPGGEREVTFFELVGDTVWGATARILRQLLVLLTDAASGA
jgi:8-oxo-dGTP pyrophosphatase MutT (NUDIX family)